MEAKTYQQEKIRKRRMKLAGYFVRHTEEVASDIVLWESLDGCTNRGRRKRNFIDNRLEDTGVDSVPELRTLMMDRDLWKERVKDDGRPGGRHRCGRVFSRNILIFSSRKFIPEKKNSIFFSFYCSTWWWFKIFRLIFLIDIQIFRDVMI